MNVSELIKDLKLERVQGSEAILQYSNFDYWVNWEDVEEIVKEHEKQPQLNDNQKIVLEHLKKITIDRSFEYALWELIDDVFECDYDSVGSESWDRLDSFKKAQVTEVFAKWVQEQEEN